MFLFDLFVHYMYINFLMNYRQDWIVHILGYFCVYMYKYLDVAGVNVQVETSDRTIFHLEAELGVPFLLKGLAKGCDDSCSDPQLPLRAGKRHLKLYGKTVCTH